MTSILLANKKKDYFLSITNSDIFKLKEILMTSSDRIWDFIDSEGNTGLILSCLNNDYEITSALLQIVSKKIEDNEEFKTWINQKADNGFNAIHYAAYKGTIKLISLLIDYKANYLITNDHGLSILHIAAQSNNVNILAYLHEYHNFSYSSTDKAGATSLHWAAYSGSIDALEFLYVNGVDINAKDKDGSTPLHLAVIAGKKNIILKLLKFNCSTNIKDKNQMTVKEIALKRGDTYISDYIAEKTGYFHKIVTYPNLLNFVFILLILLSQCNIYYSTCCTVDKKELIVTFLLFILVIVFYVALTNTKPDFIKGTETIKVR